MQRACIEYDIEVFLETNERVVHWTEEDGIRRSGIQTEAICGVVLEIPVWPRRGGARENWTHTAGDGVNLVALVTCQDCLRLLLERELAR